MKKYKIIRTVPGVRPGELHPFLFEEGTEHHIDDDLASQLYDQGALDEVKDGEAEEDAEGKAEEKTEEKSRGAAPSNKNRGAAPSNKNKAAE